jgi:hypothetical protein
MSDFIAADDLQVEKVAEELPKDIQQEVAETNDVAPEPQMFQIYRDETTMNVNGSAEPQVDILESSTESRPASIPEVINVGKESVEGDLSDSGDEIVQEKPKKIRAIDPSSHLLTSTRSRTIDASLVEEKKISKLSPTSQQKLLSANYNLPDSLLKSTQANICATLNIGRDRDERKYKDDIFWTERKPPPKSKQNPNVVSKLNQMTTAFLFSTKAKQDEDSKKEPHHVPAPINPDSGLLKATTAAKSSYVNSTPPEKPKVQLDLVGSKSYTGHAQSRLMNETAAHKSGRWQKSPSTPGDATSPDPSTNNKKDASPSPNSSSNNLKVSQVSSRLLQLNASMAAAVRQKAKPKKIDPRERGWVNVSSQDHMDFDPFSVKKSPTSAVRVSTPSTPPRNKQSIGSDSKEKSKRSSFSKTTAASTPNRESFSKGSGSPEESPFKAMLESTTSSTATLPAVVENGVAAIAIEGTVTTSEAV